MSLERLKLHDYKGVKLVDGDLQKHFRYLEIKLKSRDIKLGHSKIVIGPYLPDDGEWAYGVKYYDVDLQGHISSEMMVQNGLYEDEAGKEYFGDQLTYVVKITSNFIQIEEFWNDGFEGGTIHLIPQSDVIEMMFDSQGADIWRT